jgi:O-methyltransferase
MRTRSGCGRKPHSSPYSIRSFGPLQSAKSGYAQQLPRCDGYRHHLFDPFEGLSTPSSADAPAACVRPWRAVDMSWSLEDVMQTLSRWDDLTFHRGLIPECFYAARDAKFSFLQIVVNLYEPTREALAFFHPRLITGGVIVIDDDGFLTCPGAR